MELTKKQTESVLSNFLEKENGLNSVLEMMLNSMMLSERSVHLADSSNNKGNGYRLGKVFGHGAQIELRIPRDRQSTFMPTILALFRDQESYLREVSFKMYSKGLTTRDISEVMETIYGNHYSKSKVSSINTSYYKQMEAWRNRDLDGHYLAFYIDGLHVKLKRDNKYANECFYIILGLKEDYSREVVAIVSFPTESSMGWEQVFQDLKERGLKSVGLIVSDGLSGLENKITQEFGNTPHQKCIVHLQRNLQKYVRTTDRKELAQDFREILSPDDPSNTHEKVELALEKLAQKWESKYKPLSKYLRMFEWQPYFRYLDYSVKIRRMLYTTNWIERFNRSARRTLKVRGAFPSPESVLSLITSVAIDKSEKLYKYPIHNFKFEPQLQKQND